MKKIILSLLAFGMMSVCVGQTQVEWTKFEVSESINDLQNYIEWTMQDIEHGAIDEAIGNLYIEKYEETIDRLIVVYNNLKKIERTTIHLTQNN